MSRTVSGPLEFPDGTPIGQALLRFVATRNSYSADGSTPIYSEHSVYTDSAGMFRLDLNLGQYRVLLRMIGSSAWLTLGSAYVEAGGAVRIGELIEFTGSDLETTYPDVATRAWVIATYSAGTASSLDITDFDVGSAAAKALLRVDAGGTYITTDPERARPYYFGQMAPHQPNRTNSR